MQESITTPTPAGDLLEKGKAWYKSQTIWGTILMLISLAVKTFYPEIDVAASADEIGESLPNVANAVDGIYASILGVIGFAVAVWGRLKATLAIQ